MTFLGWAQIALYCLIIVALTRPLGGYMTRLFAGERTLLSPVLGPIERGFYRAAGVDERSEQHWVTYGLAMLAFNALGFFLLYALMRLQQFLPFNPQAMPATSEHLSFNTAVSFVTNTNWQSYGGESTLGYLVPDGRADGAELRFGGHRHRSGGGVRAWLHARQRLDDRQFLGRSRPLHALPAAAALHSCWRCSTSGRACRRTSTPTSPPRPSRAASRRSPRARSPRSSRSRCWAPTAAASSTPIPRTPTRTRPRSATSCRSSRSS